MIQIIKGTFGYYNGRKVIPITEADGPQKFDDELEARLVKEGAAKYIGEQGETAEQPAPAPGDDADEPASTNIAADEAPEYNEDMKLDELKEVAARYRPIARQSHRTGSEENQRPEREGAGRWCSRGRHRCGDRQGSRRGRKVHEGSRRVLR